MTVFLVSVLVATLIALVAAIAFLLRDRAAADARWADERAYLLNVVVAKHGQDLRSMTVPASPAVPPRPSWQDEMEGYEAPVGL